MCAVVIIPLQFRLVDMTSSDAGAMCRGVVTDRPLQDRGQVPAGSCSKAQPLLHGPSFFVHIPRGLPAEVALKLHYKQTGWFLDSAKQGSKLSDPKKSKTNRPEKPKLGRTTFTEAAHKHRRRQGSHGHV
jgi:hypothetical protein